MFKVQVVVKKWTSRKLAKIQHPNIVTNVPLVQVQMMSDCQDIDLYQ